MSKRIFCLVENCEDAEAVYKSLLLAEVPRSDIHCLCKYGVCVGTIPPATILQKTDLLHGLWRGLVWGGISGLVIGSGLYIYYPHIVSMGFALVLAMTLIGSAFGAWASSLVAISIPSSRLTSFHNEIAEGRILLMIDVPEARRPMITSLIAGHSRSGQPIIDNTVPAFP